MFRRHEVCAGDAQSPGAAPASDGGVAATPGAAAVSDEDGANSPDSTAVSDEASADSPAAAVASAAAHFAMHHTACSVVAAIVLSNAGVL